MPSVWFPFMRGGNQLDQCHRCERLERERDLMAAELEQHRAFMTLLDAQRGVLREALDSSTAAS